MTKYFNNCKTAEELKKEYKKMAIKLHPDNNKDHDTTAEFQEMQAEFTTAFERLKNIHVDKDGHQYESSTTESAEAYMDLINRLVKINGIEIELCGSWIWITGNTKPVKELLKTESFHWSKNKMAWYYHREPFTKKSKRSLSLDEIRNKYGSEKLTGSYKASAALPA